MLGHSKGGRERISITLGLYVWFILSIVGFWFIIREADPKQIPGAWVVYYLAFAGVSFLAFEWGRVCGRIYYEWWAAYMLVFVSAVIVTAVFWYVLGERAMGDLWRSNPGAIWTVDAVERSNLAGLLFLFLVIPACSGVNSLHDHDFNASKN